MKYFIDTEFIEGKQSKTFLGVKYGETKPTIDLISIGIVSEEEMNRHVIEQNSNPTIKDLIQYEYYAISKDFNLREAWNRSQINKDGVKEYWIKENVLKQIWIELVNKEHDYSHQAFMRGVGYDVSDIDTMTFTSLKRLINKYGKTNKQIAQEIIEFTRECVGVIPQDMEAIANKIETDSLPKPEFYAYYADYDWVVFCQLFGTMIDLPKGFPMYCKDLKQEADRIWETTGKNTRFNSPKGEHNALADAKWNYELYKFLNTL